MADSDASNVEESFNWSFDIHKWSKDLPAGDDFAATIRGHLYLEHVLIELLKEVFPKFDFIKIDRIAFNAKVDLCAGAGIIDPELMAPIRKINELRNKAAHSLTFSVSIQDKLNLYHILPTEVRKLLLEWTSNKLPEQISMRGFIMMIIVFLESRRNSYIAYKAKLDAAVKASREALDNIRINFPELWNTLHS